MKPKLCMKLTFFINPKVYLRSGQREGRCGVFVPCSRKNVFQKRVEAVHVR